MAKPQHRTKAHRLAYVALRRAQQRGEWHVCAERECLYPTRDIAPTDPAHVAHDPSGTVIIGVSHARCNAHEAAVRGNRMRNRSSVWVL